MTIMDFTSAIDVLKASESPLEEAWQMAEGFLRDESLSSGYTFSMKVDSLEHLKYLETQAELKGYVVTPIVFNPESWQTTLGILARKNSKNSNRVRVLHLPKAPPRPGGKQ